MDFRHETVLLREAVEALSIRQDGLYLDGTAGGGGHASLIAAGLHTGLLVALDKDPDAIEVLTQRLQNLPVRVIREDFRNIPAVVAQLALPGLDGILLDLGVSSHQLDTPERGFSYNADARLDMRMSHEGMSAWDVVNAWPQDEIARVLWQYGEEKFSRRIAGNIVRQRQEAPVDTTAQLCDIVRQSIPAPARRTGGNPAKRTFQAIRIAVNGELDALGEALDEAFDCLRTGGRFAVITFHSLEDRMVKQRFAALCRGCICQPDAPICVCGKTPRAKAITRKPLLPGEEEMAQNKRAHSAKLRVIEKI